MSQNNQRAVLDNKFRELLQNNNIHPVVKDAIKKLHFTFVSKNASENAKAVALTELNRFFVKYKVGSMPTLKEKPNDKPNDKVGGKRGRRTRHKKRTLRKARKTRRHTRRA